MKRARATALVLLNWKGVFYERYELDRHVTALEGANGAGKTTVMIACYVVLLPDLARLRFTNLGETGATGGDKGIWGRLGELGRPSYAALQLELGDGSTLIVGVQLERRAEPSLTLTPFLIHPPPDTRLQALFLKSGDARAEEIPTLAEFKAQVVAAGGKLQLCSTLKEYTASLFELGVSPLRLSTDEEKTKFNEMLRTSMTGGISRALTSELRSFLLKEEPGLGETLTRMRSNLAACRRTRVEVGEARLLEHEIAGVYDAGQAMFAAALWASRQQGKESARAVDEARRQWEAEAGNVAEQARVVGAVKARAATISSRRASAAQAWEEAQERTRRLVGAQRAAAQSDRCELALTAIKARADAALAEQQQCARARELSRKLRDQAHEELGRSALGLADLQSGLDDLHRRAHAHRVFQEKLQRLRALHGDAQGSLADLPELRVRLEEKQQELNRERARRAREGGALTERRAACQRAREALETLEREQGAGLLSKSAWPESARHEVGSSDSVRASAEQSVPERAEAMLVGRRRLEALCARRTDLQAEAARLGPLAQRQGALRTVVAALNLAEGALVDASALLTQHQLAESALRALQAQQSQAEWAVRDAVATQGHVRASLRGLEEREDGWPRVALAAERLAAAHGPLESSREALAKLRRRVEEALGQARSESEGLLEERQRALARAASLEATGNLLNPALLALCDRVEGQLLAQRYEECSPEAARQIEAHLGPLVEAIVVPDAKVAADILRGQLSETSTVWLVQAGAELGLADAACAAPETEARDVVVTTASGARVTRLPRHSVLGKAGREREARELTKHAEKLARDAEQARAHGPRLRQALQDIETLQDAFLIWRAGDPGPEVAALQRQLQGAQAEQGEQQARAPELASEAEGKRILVEQLRPLLADASLLDLPDLDQQMSLILTALGDAERARSILERTQAAAECLSTLSHVLAQPPPSDVQMAAWEAEQIALEAEQDRLFWMVEALDSIAGNWAAKDWADAAETLNAQSALVPELQVQHQRARTALDEAEAALRASESRWEAATRTSQHHGAELAVAQAEWQRAQGELRAQQVLDHSEQALERMQSECNERQQQLQSAEREDRGLSAEVALAEERLKLAEGRQRSLEEQLQRQAEALSPAEASWGVVREQAERAGVLSEALGYQGGALAETSSASLWPQARSKRELLLDRLETARGGRELALALRERFRREPEEHADGYLLSWLEVRGFLERRLPTQVAALGDPVQTLHQLRDDLGRLEARLQRQETELTGTSADVARSIEVQVRRAGGQVRRLNQSLEGIRFGSIRGIRVKLGRVEKMEQVLGALRDGSAQELLFQSKLPLEEALNEIFRRYGGGRSGGQRLLDYREYVELAVEVKRQVDQGWEPANPSQVSTGEAIGVGAALMMVILTEWERDAHLLRAKRTHGSLRFLFLDEANRLSQDNLVVLFDLCASLDLQLLIAAPEVAHAEGNTTYRLVRSVTEDGREEVLVSGRRAAVRVGEGQESPEPARQNEVAPAPTQGALFSGV